MRSGGSLLAVAAALMLASVTVLAEPVVLPGDRGRPMDGFVRPAAARPGGAPTAPPAQANPQPPKAAAPPLELALKLSQAIAESCKQYPLGVAVVDAIGTPKIIYVPDQSQGWHGYSAVRKAWTAVVFKVPTVELAERVRTDTELQAKIKADPNLMAFSGARPWFIGGALVGAVAVSGAEPGSHDDDCLRSGLERAKLTLQ